MLEALNVNVNKECKTSNYLEPKCLTYIKKLLDHKQLECKSPRTFENFKLCKNQKNAKPPQMEKVEGNVELF
jgi:hypothetical protein